MAVTTPKRKPSKRKTGDAENPWPGRLRKLRATVGKRLGLPRPISQAAAAKLIHISLRAWAAWEIGEDTPSPPFALLVRLLEENKIS